ncbi:carbohydrate ABC transporter permease [Paenibacillus macerans]|uniref:Binding--dependent transport system inner membrane component family protein n=1 Tax=Paenibacillus macerans TaxID=44252 RepID=A0A090Z8W2_PAEMA|nr:carbohydrate ABC transporter permease [Paenibacillus macerans]KFN07047.1 binding--dependent transport system inner membrane component family protein [Paenibacillus macerans]MCY7560614.1 carbohydrate ABC transporter permease [Paenibacillus macerans]MEC0150488.1 carbohydrate ABC transporter permease [Paenibacillus macerans]SUA85934.1 binding-protein-dependent transport system inner membrane protein [Paenibacillus macerans]
MHTATPISAEAPPRDGHGVLRKIRNGILWTGLTIYGILTLYPFFWLVISAFKTNADFYARPFGLPEVWRGDNFLRAWESSRLGSAFGNSLVVSAGSLALTLFIAALTSFVLARFQFRWKGGVLAFFVVGMLIPIHSTLVPLFILMKQMSLLNTYWALILPYTAFALPTAIFVLTAYLTSVPRELEEAAFIDGTGLWGLFFRIMLPMSVPALATVTIISFLHAWNDFSFALVFINKTVLKTLPLAIANFADGYQTDYGLTLAAMMLSVLPTIALYLLFQEQMMKGMTAGAVKG